VKPGTSRSSTTSAAPLAAAHGSETNRSRGREEGRTLEVLRRDAGESVIPRAPSSICVSPPALLLRTSSSSRRSSDVNPGSGSTVSAFTAASGSRSPSTRLLALVEAVRKHSPQDYRSRNVAIVQVFSTALFASLRWCPRPPPGRLRQPSPAWRAGEGRQAAGGPLQTTSWPRRSRSTSPTGRNRHRPREQALFVSQRRGRLSVRAVQES